MFQSEMYSVHTPNLPRRLLLVIALSRFPPGVTILPYFSPFMTILYTFFPVLLSQSIPSTVVCISPATLKVYIFNSHNNTATANVVSCNARDAEESSSSSPVSERWRVLRERNAANFRLPGKKNFCFLQEVFWKEPCAFSIKLSVAPT